VCFKSLFCVVEDTLPPDLETVTGHLTEQWPTKNFNVHQNHDKLWAMNIPLTHAADGLERRAFTAQDVLRMVETGILGLEERFELIGGEIVPMSPKGIIHERMKVSLCTFLIENRGRGIEVAQETTLYLSDNTFIEPDFVLYSEQDGLENLSGEKVLLAIEVADSSLEYDLGRKAALYAEFGVRELWVIDARNLQSTIHLSPKDRKYGSVRKVKADAALEPSFLPGPRIILSDISG